MEWLNEHSGLLILIVGIIAIALLAVLLWFVYTLRRSIAVQRLNFLGSYSSDLETHESYASLTIGNKSLNDVGVAEIGIKNGKVNFDLTALYKEKKGIAAESRVVIEQRSSIAFTLTSKELNKLLVEKNGKKQLKTLRLYAVDLTGNLYQGKISAVRKLLGELLQAQKPTFED